MTHITRQERSVNSSIPKSESILSQAHHDDNRVYTRCKVRLMWQLTEYSGMAQIADVVVLRVRRDADVWAFTVETMSMRRCQTGYSSMEAAQIDAEVTAHNALNNAMIVLQ